MGFMKIPHNLGTRQYRDILVMEEVLQKTLEELEKEEYEFLKMKEKEEYEFLKMKELKEYDMIVKEFDLKQKHRKILTQLTQRKQTKEEKDASWAALKPKQLKLDEEMVICKQKALDMRMDLEAKYKVKLFVVGDRIGDLLDKEDSLELAKLVEDFTTEDTEEDSDKEDINE